MARTETEIREWIVDYLSECLDLPREQFAVDQRIEDFGLDSVDAVSLAGGLEEWLGVAIDPTLPYDFPTISQLSGKLAEIGNAAAS